MSRSVFAATVAILFFTTFLATFTSAAPAAVARGEPNVVCRNPSYTGSTNSTDTSTDTPNSTTDNPPNTDSNNNSNSNNVKSDVSTSSYYAMGGRATWYQPGLGACGGYNTASDFIVAMSQADWAGGSHCGQQLQLSNPANGRSCSVTVRDMCPGCGSGSLDLSPAVFQYLDDSLDNGVFTVAWNYA